MSDKEKIPRRLSKGWLRDYFDLNNTWSLKDEFFTSDIINQLGLTNRTYNNIKVFSIKQSRQIIKLLKAADLID